jgi:hypothetical protein
MRLVPFIRSLFSRPEDSGQQVESAQGRDSPDQAHLFLLSRFLACSSVDQFRDDRRRDVLGEPPKRAIYRFIEAGLIEEATVAEKLVSSYSAIELRTILKGAGLTGSGSKADMARRFAGQRPGEAREKVARIAAFRCTKRGCELAEAVVAGYRKEREDAEHAVSEALSRGDFGGAADAVVQFEARQVFPRGVGVRWDAPETDRLAREVSLLYQVRPGILDGLSEATMRSLRPKAARMMLWGESRLGEKLETGTHFSGDVAARMLVFSVNAQSNLREMRASGVAKRVEIGVTDDSCEECKKLAPRKYRLTKVPELPHPACTHAMGCRCLYLACT